MAADFAELHRGYERKAGIDCSTLIRILHHVATAHEGERHAEIRRELARVITTDAAATRQAAAAKLQERVAALCRQNSSIDLIQDLVRPVCDTCFEALLGTPAVSQAEEGVSASQIFDMYLGLNRRREINAKVCALVEGFVAANGTLKTSPGYAAALRMLGYDSIVASLGCSLLHVVEQAAGRRLCEIEIPNVLPATGVPYIERIAASDIVIRGARIGEGERVRLYLDSGDLGSHAANRPYFGRGRHSCLGEEMSSWLWRSFVEKFSRLALSCTIESATRRKPDWVFVYYSSIRVRFDA